jgi:hypothetical protein
LGGDANEQSPERRSYEKAAGEHRAEEAYGSTAYAGREALGLIGIAGAGPDAVRDLVDKEVHDGDDGVLVCEEEEKVERGNEKSGAYKHLSPPPRADQGPQQIQLLSHVRNGQDEKVQVIGCERPAREGDDYEVDGVATAPFGDSPLPV